MKNSTFKLLATLLFGMLVYTAQAQDQTICEGAVKNYTVDTEAPDGANPDGTPGSWYAWSVIEPAFAGTITAGDDPDGAGTNDSNQATIDWDTTPVGTYTVQVIETTGTCVGDPITFTVEIVSGPTAPTVIADPSAICSGDDAVFTITGAPGNVVTYTINGGAPQTTTILGTGEVDVVIPGVTADQTIVITLVATDGSPDACTTAVTGVTATVTVNAAPITSPIQAL